MQSPLLAQKLVLTKTAFFNTWQTYREEKEPLLSIWATTVTLLLVLKNKKRIQDEAAVRPPRLGCSTCIFYQASKPHCFLCLLSLFDFVEDVLGRVKPMNSGQIFWVKKHLALPRPFLNVLFAVIHSSVPSFFTHLLPPVHLENTPSAGNIVSRSLELTLSTKKTILYSTQHCLNTEAAETIKTEASFCDVSLFVVQSLDTTDLQEVGGIQKPDFIAHPERYFSESSAGKRRSKGVLPSLPNVTESKSHLQHL